MHKLTSLFYISLAASFMVRTCLLSRSLLAFDALNDCGKATTHGADSALLQPVSLIAQFSSATTSIL